MDYEVTVNIPTAGAGTPVLITGLGEIKNGTTVQVDSEQAFNFKTLTGKTLGRARFQEGIEVKTLRGAEAEKKKSDAKTPEKKPTPDHVEGTPTPVQNRDGETAKDGDK